MPVLVAAADSPHWTTDGCQTCHMEAAPADGVVNLQASDAEALCESCHGGRGDAISCRHASGIAANGTELPEQFRASLKGGEVVCTTCHDVVYQCDHPTKPYSFMNPGFLRDRKSPESSEYCSSCHETTEYKKLNPHLGVAGAPPRPSCLLCHSEFPAAGPTGNLVVEFNMQHDLDDACKGCHVVRPHPKSMSFGAAPATEEWVHLVAPSAEVLENMRESQTNTGIELPLNPFTGEIFCATCHNPHEFKVGGEHGSQESGMKRSLRQHDICQACHDK